MRETAPEKSPRNILSDCLVESDPAVRAAGRRTRVASVGVSLLMQAALLTLLIIVPLLAAGKLPAMQWQAPTPIFRRGDPSAPPAPHGQRQTGGPTASPQRLRFDLVMNAPVPNSRNIIGEPSPVGTESVRGCPGCPEIEGAPPPMIGEDTLLRPSLPNVPPPAARKPLPVHKDVMEARLIHRVLPPYPPLAKMTGRSGDVELRAIIGVDGRVHSLEVISGHPLLIEAAKQAVLQWRYQPTLLNGQPTEVDTFITVKFVLSR